jgi:hypothetical protein
MPTVKTVEKIEIYYTSSRFRGGGGGVERERYRERETSSGEDEY